MPPVGFPRSIFAYFRDEGHGVLMKAVPLMTAYKRKDRGFEIFDRPFDPAKFNREKPWFVRLWGVVKPGQGGDQIEMHATMSGEEMVELLAFVGPTHDGYPLLMPKSQFDREYEVD